MSRKRLYLGDNLLTDNITAMYQILSAFIGGFFGAFLTRLTQHRKWIFERRAESFATFLKMLSESRKIASDLLHDETMSLHKRKGSATEAYFPALDYANIVKLYLPKSLRNKFYDHAIKYSVLHTEDDLGDVRFTTMQKHLDEIQQIFEQELEELDAYGWVLRFIIKVKSSLTSTFKGK